MNPEASSPYNKLPTNHEAVTKYEPKFLAKGGDHLVYEVVGHPNSVIKASTFTMRDILTHNAESSAPLDSLPEEMEDWVGRKSSPEMETAAKNAQIQELRKSFGNEHTLAEKRFLMKVPVTEELLDQIFAEDIYMKRAVPAGAENLKEVWTSVVVQERSDEIGNTHLHSMSLNFGSFVESRKGELKADTKKLLELNQELILQPTTASKDLFLELQDSPQTQSIHKILKRTVNDFELKETVSDFVKKTILYTDQTGNILALAGQNNVILFKKENRWSYLLVDAIPVHNEPMFAFTKDLLHKIALGEDVWKDKKEKEIVYEKELIMKTFNFIRTINGLAIALDIPERIELLSSEDKDKIDLTAVLS